MIATIAKRIAVAGTVVALVSAGPVAALAETMNFKLLPRYSPRYVQERCAAGDVHRHDRRLGHYRDPRRGSREAAGRERSRQGRHESGADGHRQA